MADSPVVSYPALDVTTSDAWEELLCPGSTRLRVQISNNPVTLQFGHGSPPAYDANVEPYLPIVGTLVEPGGFDAVRVKSYTPGGSATAQVKLIPKA